MKKSFESFESASDLFGYLVTIYETLCILMIPNYVDVEEYKYLRIMFEVAFRRREMRNIATNHTNYTMKYNVAISMIHVLYGDMAPSGACHLYQSG